jgi:hypothetical protein
VLAALARALQLSSIESDHLLQLAGYRPTTTTPTAPPAHAVRMIDQLDAQPAAIYDRSWNPVAWNPLWASVNGDPNERQGNDRNMVWRHFAASATRVQRTDTDIEQLQRTLVGDLRARHGRHPGDTTLARLIEDLRTHQPRFHAMWEHREVHAYRHEVKTFDHPGAGLMQLDCDIVALDGQQQYQANHLHGRTPKSLSIPTASTAHTRRLPRHRHRRRNLGLTSPPELPCVRVVSFERCITWAEVAKAPYPPNWVAGFGHCAGDSDHEVDESMPNADRGLNCVVGQVSLGYGHAVRFISGGNRFAMPDAFDICCRAQHQRFGNRSG